LVEKESDILNEIDFFLTKGNYKEGLKIIDKHIDKSTQESVFNIKLLLRKCRIYYYISDYTTCLTEANQSLKLGEKMKDRLIIIDSLQIKGEVYNELGHTNEVSSIIKQIKMHLGTIQEEKEIEKQRREAEYYKLSGLFQTRKSDLDKAFESYQKSLELFKKLDIKEKIAEVSYLLGYLFLTKGDWERGSIIFDAIEIQEEIGNKEALSRSYLILSEQLLRDFKLEKASSYVDKIFKLLENTKNKYLLGQVNNNRGLIYYLQGDFNSALNFLNKSLDFFRTIDNKGLIASLISNIGLIHMLRGDFDLALASFDQCLSIFEELGIQQNVAYHLNKLGSVYARKGEYDLALVYFNKTLEIMKQLKVEKSIAKTLFRIISVSIYDNDIDNAQQYLMQLQKLNKDTSIKKIDLWARVAEALVLKSQENEKDVEHALNLLKQIADEEIIDIEIYGDVLLNLCDILLDQLRKKSQENYLKEIRKYLNLLYEMASKQDSYWLIAQANWLLAYLAVIELDMIKAKHMFAQAQQLADERGFKRLAMNISNEFDKMIKRSSSIESITKKDIPLVERVERSGFEAVIKKIKQNIVDEEDLRVEKPIMLFIFSQKGIPIYRQFFLQEKLQLNDVIIEEFISVIKSLIFEISKDKKPIQRIFHRELLVILKSYDDLSFCYVFDGQSYAAINRLELIISSLQEQTSLFWNKILVHSKKDQTIEKLTEQEIKQFIDNLFTTTN